MFAAVRKGDTAFVKDLIGALAAAAVAAARPDSAVPVLKLLAECLLHFGRGDGEVCCPCLMSQCLCLNSPELLDVLVLFNMRLVDRSYCRNVAASCSA